MFDHSQQDKSLFIQKRYPVTDSEFEILEKKYGKLCWFAASKLASSNNKSEEDLQDFHSEILIGMFRAGSYYKRQTFIENVFEFLDNCKIYMKNEDLNILKTLKTCWNRKANFTEKQEVIIRELLEEYKNSSNINAPSEKDPLLMDSKFDIYCKAIIWNTQKALGQNISKENEHKNKEISLDEWSFLEGGDISSAINDGISYMDHHIYNDLNFSVRNKLCKLEDERPLKTFDIITNPENYQSVFKQKKGKKEGIKINVVRKKTNMSYRTINKQLKIIKKIIMKELDF